MSNGRSFLASIVESSDDAIIGINLSGAIASWNVGAQKIYGYRAEEIIGQPIYVLALPERLDEVSQFLTKVRHGERVTHFQTMHLRKNGQVIYVSLTISPVIDEYGRILGASAIARDITSIFRAQEALREAEEKYRLVFSAESDAIILFDMKKYSIVDFNEAALALYGYEREEFSRLTLFDLQLDPDLKEGLSGRIIRTPLAHHRRKDGTLFPAEMSVSRFFWKGQSLIVGIVRDITERQKIHQLQHSLTIAKEIQQRLLPRKKPYCPGLDVSGASLYCEDIGGDYYDFIPMEEGKSLSFVVGDVTGHGIAAALLMAMGKGLLRAEVERWGTNLGKLFVSLNEHLFHNTDESFFMTLFCGLYDFQKRTLRWNSAGHGPVFLFRNSIGGIEELPTTGPPLGIKEGETFKTSRPIVLGRGDVLLIGTDGIWETRNPVGEMFGVQRLRQVLATRAEASASEIYETIMEKVRDFSAGERQEDDRTIVVVKVVDGD